MAQAVGREPYLEQLQALLPRGAAWPRDPDSVLTLLLESIAESLADVDSRAVGLLSDIRPNVTVDLLADWERVVGIPDDCSQLASTISQRIAALLTKVVPRSDLNAETFEEVIESFGITTATIEEHDQTRAATATTLDTTGGRWRNVWWVTLPTSGDDTFFSVLSPVNAPLLDVERNTELECRLQELAPAHTLLRVAYGLTVMPVMYRFDMISDLTGFASGAALGSDDGQWEIIASGSTDSGNTGPGSNSDGPYAATDASGGTFSEMEDNSELELSVVGDWPVATNRVLRLRLALIGDFAASGQGLAVQGREGSGSWEDISLIRGWPFSNSYSAGDTITDDDGDDLTCAQDGGWVDVDTAIADRFDDVRLRLMVRTGSTTRKDVALWSAELRNS